MRKRVSAFLLIAAVCFLLPPSSRAAGEAALLAKHKAFAGFTFGDGSVPPLDVSGEVTGLKDGTLHSRSHTLWIGGVYRTDQIDVKSGTASSTGYTGKLFWYSNESGFTVPITEDPGRLSYDRTLVLSDAVAVVPWKITGTAHFDGRTQQIVRVNPADGFPLDVYVNQDDGSYDRAVLYPGADEEETMLILGYTEPVPGKKLISKWRYADDEQMRTVTSMKPAPAISPADLHPPALTAQWSSLGATLPLKFTKNRIVVKASVNGVEGTFLLDTGAFGILLSGDFARRAGIKATGHTSTYGFFGESKTDVGRAARVDIGGNTLVNPVVYFGADDFSDDDAPDGLMGYDLFAGTYVTLDFQKATMKIADPSDIDEASLPGIHVAADLTAGQPVLPVRVADAVEVRGMFDTGTPQDMWMSRGIIPIFGLRYYTTNRSDDCGRVDAISVGKFRYAQPQACSWFGTTRDAIVGLPVMKKLKAMTFDYPRAIVTLIP